MPDKAQILGLAMKSKHACTMPMHACTDLKNNTTSTLNMNPVA